MSGGDVCHRQQATTWFVYIVRCRDNSLYTGITTALERRIDEHNHGTVGAKYTRGRRPVKLVYHESWQTRSQAARREADIKRMAAVEKRRLCGLAR